MAKRKLDPKSEVQMDMFGGWVIPANEQPIQQAPELLDLAIIEAANDQIEPETPETDLTGTAIVEASELAPKFSVASVKPPNNWENDEWWTTAMVCVYLKLGRKAIWERTRHPTIGFPQPTHFGSCRHRWRAGEVKAWATMRSFA